MLRVLLYRTLAIKAIHILVEVVSDMTTNTFLAAIRRFIARRGKFKQIFSDNHMTFFRASKLFGKEIQQIEISKEIQQEAIHRHFTPPAPPNVKVIW